MTSRDRVKAAAEANGYTATPKYRGLPDHIVTYTRRSRRVTVGYDTLGRVTYCHTDRHYYRRALAAEAIAYLEGGRA